MFKWLHSLHQKVEYSGSI